MNLNSYELSRKWFDWCFENPELINPNHSAIYFFAIEHCNRLGWKKKFGFPSQMTMDAIGIKKHSTYIKYFNDLVEWGFFELIQKSKNQYSANIISLSDAMPKSGKALSKAMVKHREKQGDTLRQSTGKSKRSIDKPYNQEPNNQELYKNKFNFKNSLIELGIDKSVVSDWLKVRAKKKATNTETAFNGIERELNKLKNLSKTEALIIAVERSWVGIKYDWLKEEDKPKANKNGFIMPR